MEPQFSIVIPAYNEEQYLEATLKAVHKAISECPYEGEVIVVDNNSDDKTAQIAKEQGTKVVFEPINQISKARNAGGRAAMGKWLVFVDADTLIDGDLLSRALANLASGECCGGGAITVFDEELEWPVYHFVNGWNWLAVNRGLAAGSFVYCLKEGFDAVEGFSEQVYASEEVWFSRALRHWGEPQGLKFKVITEAKVLTSNRKLHWYSSVHLLFQFIILVFFPFALYSRRLCNLWYARPKKESETSD